MPLTDEQIDQLAVESGSPWGADKTWIMKFARAIEHAASDGRVAELIELLRGAANYIDKLGGVSTSYRQAIAEHDAK